MKHDKPNRLFARALRPRSCHRLQAEHFKPDLAVLEANVPPRCTRGVEEIGIVEHFKKLPEYRERVESYPLFSLVALILLAMLCEAPRGQTDLAKFAGSLNQGQRRALVIRRNLDGKYPAPSQSTFSRFLAGIDPRKLQETLLEIQRLVRDPAPRNELVVTDDNEPPPLQRHFRLERGHGVQQHFWAASLADQKTNEIPVAQKELIPALDLEGRLVSLDALHAKDETARAVVLEGGGDYTLTVKNHQANTAGPISKRMSPLPERISPIAQPTSTQARTCEENKGPKETEPSPPRKRLPKTRLFHGPAGRPPAAPDLRTQRRRSRSGHQRPTRSG